MIPNNFRRLRPIINTTEQQTCSGVDAFRPHPRAGKTCVPPAGKSPVPPAGKSRVPPAGKSRVPPAGKSPVPPAGKSPVPPAGKSPVPPAGRRPVPPPVPKKRAWCSVCGNIPSFDIPVPKRIPFLNIPDDKPKRVWTLTDESCFTHHITRRREGCSVCGSIPLIVTPPPKKIPFLKVTDNTWNRAWNQSVERHMGGVLPPLNPKRPHVRQRVLEEERHEDEDDVRTSIQKAEAEARIVKIALRDNFVALRVLNERITKLETELLSLEEESKTFDALQCQVFQSLPPELQKSFVWNPHQTNPEDERTGHPEHIMLLKTIKEELGTIYVHQKAIAGEMMSRKEKLDRLRMEWKIIYQKRDENLKLVENINFKMMKLGDSLEAIRMSRMELMRTIQEQ